MMKSSSFSEYVERVKERCCNSSGREMLRCCIWRLLLSADRHLARFDLAARRYERAKEHKDTRAEHVERDNMLALLYESADTVYMVVQILDPDLLDLTSSLDGVGISGEDAGFVLDAVKRLEKISGEILRCADEHGLRLDFSRPVDEREGVTYTQHCHWRDFVDGSVEQSFYSYFAEAQRAVSHRLAQVPRFWRQRALKHVYGKLPAISRLLRALLTAGLHEPLAKRIEKHVVLSVRRHWPVTREGEFVWHGKNKTDTLRQ